MDNRYDLAIIGSGPCGYVAAIHASQIGMKVCIIEKDALGGVCLNQGCIPTKALSVSAGVYYNIERANEFGINVRDYNINFQGIQDRKNNIIKRLTQGIETLLRSRKVEIVKGRAVLRDQRHIVVGDIVIEFANLLIASGSRPLELEGMPFDGVNILSSTHMLDLKEIPRAIVIVGGGVIGCEFASIFKTFGSDVTIVEAMEHILPTEDEELSRKLEQIFRDRGIKVFTNKKVDELTFKAERILVCIGRRPNSEGFGLEELGIECDKDKGWIKVDKNFRTNIKNIYAAGDVKGGMLLAHVASREGVAAVEAMAGMDKALDYNAVPNCIFTNPEIASVGLTEKKARKNGIDATSRKFLFSAVAKPHILGETEGFIKLVVDNRNDRILGGHIIGPGATELIAELSLCVQFGITSEQLAGAIHGHPTLSEIVHEVSKSVHGRAIHSL